jgi:hypothetical protein
MLSQLLLLRTHTDTMPKAMATTKPSGEATESASSPSTVRMPELEAAIAVRYAIELSAVWRKQKKAVTYRATMVRTTVTLTGGCSQPLR